MEKAVWNSKLVYIRICGWGTSTRNLATCTVETVCCFLPQCGQLKKHGKNQIKSKKTCFFLFLFCFLTVFLICTFVQNYNRTGRNLVEVHPKLLSSSGFCRLWFIMSKDDCKVLWCHVHFFSIAFVFCYHVGHYPVRTRTY